MMSDKDMAEVVACLEMLVSEEHLQGDEADPADISNLISEITREKMTPTEFREWKKAHMMDIVAARQRIPRNVREEGAKIRNLLADMFGPKP